MVKALGQFKLEVETGGIFKAMRGVETLATEFMGATLAPWHKRYLQDVADRSGQEARLFIGVDRSTRPDMMALAKLKSGRMRLFMVPARPELRSSFAWKRYKKARYINEREVARWQRQARKLCGKVGKVYQDG